MKRWLAAAIVATATASACSVGGGEGSVTGSLVVPVCEADLSQFDMRPDFFAGMAVSARNPPLTQLNIRIQKGGDIQEYSDSLSIAVSDTSKVQDGVPIEVKLFRPPGSAPSVPYPLVRMSLTLRKSCGNGRVGPSDPNAVVLHAVSGTITFTHILRGDPVDADTNDKRIEGSFDVVLEDPRHAEGEPATSYGKLQGNFKFFYQRGGPAQPFP
ncbi:MAG: hypothetical protein IPJ34_09090 [Myxococcales bacterium]|nr:hypothetical protein [Myxococcales bacterium]MBL8720804.1 hypothetical protein [Myxococcales bacterium]